MLPIPGRPPNRPGSSRREFLRVGGLTLGGLNLSTLLNPRAHARGSPPPKAKSCLLIFMDGGPSHPAPWDLKPDPPAEVRGEFQPNQSAVPGLTAGERPPPPRK